MKTFRILAGVVVLSISAASSHAQALTGTLKKIQETGTITMGVRESSIPFSYLDEQQHYVGYSVDLCMKVVSAVRKSLGMSALKVVQMPVTSATRFALIANGTIDMECGSTGNTLERQKQVAFSPTFYIAATRLLTKKSANIRGLNDMQGKTLVSTAGTTVLTHMHELNRERKLNIDIKAAPDHAEGLLMLETGRATAFAMDDILLASLVANSRTPGAYTLSADSYSVEPYGIMLRRDDTAFKKIVDDAVIDTFRSGEIGRIYVHWFQSPALPKGINLNWPMSDLLKKVIANPTDSGNPATYQ
jgi:glutamate/aspartate transport system substrate-binding protein